MSLLSRLPRNFASLASTRNCVRNYSAATAPVPQNPAWQKFSKYVEVSEEVRTALAEKTPVVALESAIITHGLPYPDNIELAAEVEAAVREHGAIPATTAVVNGVARIGLASSMIEALGSGGGKKTHKVSRRDLPFLTGLGKDSGGTTVAGTMVLAHSVGIKVFATGGIGGVHRGAADSMDISADLAELGRTNVAVVCSGPKPFLDIERTIEYLETVGVPAITFGDPRAEETFMPLFYSRDSRWLANMVIESPKEAAHIVYASHEMGLQSGQLFFNPIPHEYHINHKAMKEIITGAVTRSRKLGITGKAVTPFTLEIIRQKTKGASIPANRALVLNNARQAAKIAVELAILSGRSSAGSFVPSTTWRPTPKEESQPVTSTGSQDLLVIGSIAVDISCDAATSVTLQTSNPSQITEAIGGVGHNVATAAHYAGAKVQLVSALGKDLSGDWAIERIKAKGMDPSGVQFIGGKRTARYVSFNGANGDMSVASADMKIIEDIDPEWLVDQIVKSKPKWLCMDGNLSQENMKNILVTAREHNIKVAFEPTSVEKSTRILDPGLRTFPKHDVSLSSPNELELASMFNAAKEGGLFESKRWFEVIDAINVESTFHNEVETLGRKAGIDFSATGLIQQAIHLSPYFPNQLIKLGEKGVLSVRLMTAETELVPPEDTICSKGTGNIQGVWVNHFPAEQAPENIISVNGVGDTFLGVFLGKYSKTEDWERSIGKAQKAAVMTLASSESVSPAINATRKAKKFVVKKPHYGNEPHPFMRV